MKNKQEFINWFLQAEKYLSPLLAKINYEMILNENDIKFVDFQRKHRPKFFLMEIHWTLEEAIDLLFEKINNIFRDHYDCCN